MVRAPNEMKNLYFSDWHEKRSSGQQLALCESKEQGMQAYLVGTQKDRGATQVTVEILLFLMTQPSVSEKQKKTRPSAGCF